MVGPQGRYTSDPMNSLIVHLHSSRYVALKTTEKQI